MTDVNTLSPCPHLEPCPWCGCALYAVWRRANPRASCKTEGCFGRKIAVVNLDDPRDVAAWNRRAPTPAPTDAAPAGMEPPKEEQHTLTFRRHEITLIKDAPDRNWYIRVRTPSGLMCYDGWWHESTGKTWREALEEAKRGACLPQARSKP